mmetsp:Transcript_49603/g.142214  ORF Transcript_49603/g.142214 Transcript_49603/m.142214 type:complete len:337 (+) Transcript_49603:1224-2234(+)
MYFVLASEHSTPYFSLALSNSYTFFTDSCKSCLTSSTSLDNCTVSASCDCTVSDCFFVLSSVLITDRFKTSRSRIMSWMILLSLSTCFLTKSTSRMRFSVSALSMNLAVSNSCRSSSSKAFRRRSWSYVFWILSRSDVHALISSCLAFISLLSSRFSSWICLLFSSSSALTFFCSSISSKTFRSSACIASTLCRCSLRRLSSSSFWASCVAMLCLISRKLLSRDWRVLFSSESSFSRRSRRRSSRSASVRLALSTSWMLAISDSPWMRSDSCFCTASVSAMLSSVIFLTWPSNLSRVRSSSSRCAMRLFTVFSWFTLKPAPCSTKWLKFAISTFKL